MTVSWLFVRGDESIWLQRSSPEGCGLEIHGPLSLRRHYAFAHLDELQAFVDSVAARLLPAGWAMQRFEPGDDRRRGPRAGEAVPAPDRRGGPHSPTARHA